MASPDPVYSRPELHLHRLFFDHSGQGILILKGAQVQECNTRSEQLFHLTRQELLQSQLSDLMPEKQSNGADSAASLEAKVAEMGVDDPRHFTWQFRRGGQGSFYAHVSLVKVEVAVPSLGAIAYTQLSVREFTEDTLASQLALSGVRYEQGLVACSQALMEDTPHSIKKALEELRRAANVTRVALYQNQSTLNEKLGARLHTEANAPGLPAQADGAGLVSFTYAPRWEKAFKDGLPVSQTFTKKGKRGKEWAQIEAAGVQAALLLPVLISGQWGGFLCFEDHKKERTWKDSEIQLLKSAAELIGEYLTDKTIESELKSSREMLQLVIDNIPQMIFWKDRSNKYLGANRAFAAALHKTDPSELIGKTDQELGWSEEETLLFHATDQRVMENAQPEFDIVEPRTRGQRKVWLNTTKVPLFDQVRDVVGVLGMVTDITEEKQTQEQLQAQLERRQRQVELTVEISQEISAAPALGTLFREVVTLVKERFGYYHAQIFRYEPALNAVVLVTGYGAVGEKMLAAGHRLAVGRGVVGTALETGKPVLATDTTLDPDWLPNPNLPATKGELAVPIRLRDEIIGVLDVQSDQAGALSADDQLLLEGLCGQIAVAVQETRLRQEMQESLEELRSLQRVMSRQGWQEYQQELARTAPEKQISGYSFNEQELLKMYSSQVHSPVHSSRDLVSTPKDVLIPDALIPDAPTEGGSISGGSASSPLYQTRLAVRGEPIGMLGIEGGQDQAMQPEDFALLEAISIQVSEALEKARLLDQTRRQSAEVDALNEMGRRLSGTTNLDEMYEIVYEYTSQLLNIQDSYIAIYNEADENIYFPLAYEAGERITIPSRPRGVGLTDYILTSKQPLRFSGGEEAMRKQMEALGIQLMLVGQMSQSWIGVPLLIGERAMGVISIQSLNPQNQLTERQQDLLVAIGRQASIALENARLFQSTQAALTETQTLYTISSVASRSLVLENALDEVLNQVLTIIGFDAGIISVLNPETKTLEIGAHYRLPEPLYNKLKANGLGGTLCELVFLRQDVVIVDDMTIDSPVDVTGLIAMGFRSYLGVPLESKGQVLGTLCTFSKQPRAPKLANVNLAKAVGQQVGISIDNAQSYELLEKAVAITQRRAAQLQAAAQVSQTASSVLEMQQLLQESVELIRERLELYYVGIFLADDENKWAALRAGTGDAGRIQLERNHKLEIAGSSMIGQAVARGKAQVSQDISETETIFHNPLLPDTRSELALPLTARNRTIGAMTIQSSQIRAFSDEDITTLQTMANQLAIAIQNAQLFERIQASLTETQTLYTISSVASRSLVLENTLDEVLDQVLSITGFDAGIISVFNDDAQKLEIAAHHELPDPLLNKVTTQGLGGTLCELVYLRQDVVIVDDMTLDAPIDVTGLISMGFRSYLGVPLESKGRVLGTLCSFSKRPRAPQIANINLAKAVGQQVGIAIDNAHSYELMEKAVAETRRRVQELTTLFTVSQTLSSGVLNPVEIGRAVLPILASVLGENVTGALALYNAPNKALEILCRTLPQEVQDGDMKVYSPQEPIFDPAPENWNYRLADYPATARVLDSQEPLVIQFDDQEADSEELRYMAKEGFKSLVLLPLSSKGKSIGLIELQAPSDQYSDPEKSVLPQDQLSLLVTLSNQTAVALENAQLYLELSERLGEQQLLYQVTTAAASAPSLTEALSKAATTLSEALNQAYIAILLVDPNSGVLHVDASAGYDRDLSELRIQLGEGVTGTVAQNGKTARISDITKTAHYIAGAEEVRSELAVPLKLANRVIGVVNAESKRIGAFGEDQQRLLETLSSTLAAIISNAQLFQAEQRQRQVALTLAAASAKMSQSVDEAELRQLLINEIAEYIQPDQISMYDWHESQEHFSLDRRQTAGNPYADGLIPGDTVSPGERPDLWRVYQRRRSETRELKMYSSQAPVYSPQDQDELSYEIYLFPWHIGDQTTGVIEMVLTAGRTRPRLSLLPEDSLLCEGLIDQGANALKIARLYQEQLETAERLKEVDRLKSEFLANMSHELRTPLNSIIGFSRVILKGIDGPISDLQEQDLSAIYNAGQHLLGLINDVLDISKIEAGKMELAFDEIDLKTLINGVMSTAKGLVKDRSIQLIQEIDPDLPTVQADNTRIRQVILNLVSNACKFTDHGSVTVRAKQAVHHGRPAVIVSITDTGIGIAPEDQDKLFESFSQVDSSATRQAGGTGLGLAISRSLIELHGGDIWIESEIGKGATFSFNLPLPFQETEETARIILAIDDNPGVLALYHRYLEPHGYELVELSDPNRAQDVAGRIRPLAILLDTVLPGANGWEILTSLASDPRTKEIPVIICSLATEQRRAFALGASDYLVKPILELDLTQAVKRTHEKIHPKRALVIGPPDHAALEPYCLALEKTLKFQVATAGESTAIETAHRQHPQLIIVDMAMENAEALVQHLQESAELENPTFIFLSDSPPKEILSSGTVFDTNIDAVNRDADEQGQAFLACVRTLLEK